MPGVLLERTGAWYVYWRWTPGCEGVGVQLLDATAAEAWVREQSGDEEVMGSLRRVLADELPGGQVGMLGHFELLDQVAAQLRSGWLRIGRWRTPKLFPLPDDLPPPVEEPPPQRQQQRMPAPLPVHHQCSDPGCVTAFSNAAADGTPFVQRGGECC